MTEPRPQIMSSMRNEGAHVIEWLAYHRVIGFDHAAICSNDCIDGTDDLLDALAAAGLVTHIRNEVPEGVPPQHAAAALLMAHFHRLGTAWVLHIDTDEFLNVQLGRGTVQDLLTLAEGADCMAIAWRNFGDSGHGAWPGATLPHFTHREFHPYPRDTFFKCLFRPAAFEGAYAHMPTRPRGEPVLVNAEGDRLDTEQLHADGPRVRFFPVELADRAEFAMINHYAVKSPEVFEMKRRRGRGENVGGRSKYRVGSEWHRRANRNDVEDRTILRHWEATQAEMARLRALPGVAEIEARATEWFDKRRQRFLT